MDSAMFEPRDAGSCAVQDVATSCSFEEGVDLHHQGWRATCWDLTGFCSY